MERLYNFEIIHFWMSFIFSSRYIVKKSVKPILECKKSLAEWNYSFLNEFLNEFTLFDKKCKNSCWSPVTITTTTITITATNTNLLALGIY
jgi:hypothetical protein